MKYSVQITISAPIAKVHALFDNKDNLKEWQPTLVSFDHVSGEPGSVGAVSKLVYKMGKKDFEMMETITVMNLPEEFTATFEGPGMWNWNQNLFEEVDENTTRWVSNNEFKSGKLMMKVMLFLMPGAFKKETLKFMNYFKEYAEK